MARALGLKYVQRITGGKNDKPDNEEHEKHDGRRERPSSKRVKDQCFKCDGFGYRAFKCPSAAKKGDGTRFTGSKDQHKEHQGESLPASRKLLKSADRTEEKEGSRGLPRQKGDPACRTRSKSGAIDLVPEHMNSTSVSHAQLEDSVVPVTLKISLSPCFRGWYSMNVLSLDTYSR